MVLKLSGPPIDEVVVGLAFEQPTGPDAVMAGRYWATRRDRFSRHEIHDPIVPAGTFIIGPGQSRVWLVSADEAWLIQLQHDRFIANWRRRPGAGYPGFSGDGGVLAFAMNEFNSLSAFMEKEVGAAPKVAGFELSKIDLLFQGVHWKDAGDAAKLIPSLSGVIANMETPNSNIGLQWQEDNADGALSLSLLPVRRKSEPNDQAFRAEFKLAGVAGDDLGARLVRASESLNTAFERVFPKSEHGRFK